VNDILGAEKPRKEQSINFNFNTLSVIGVVVTGRGVAEN